MTIKSIQGRYIEETYNEIKAIKDASGLSWSDFIYEAAKDWKARDDEMYHIRK